MIYLPAKAPGETMDYDLDMSPFIPTGFSIDFLSVEVTDSGNGESPLTLSAVDSSTQPPVVGGAFNTSILFWLTGGTAGVRYRGLIVMSDDESMSPDRTYRRKFEIEVRPL